MKTKYLVVCMLVFSGCTSDNGALDSSSSTEAPNVNKAVVQNSSFTQDLQVGSATGVTITENPTHGSVTVNGTEVTYRLTDPLYNGADQFKYQLQFGAELSNEATVSVSVSALASGTTVHTENYAGGAYALTGWESFSSTFGHISSAVSFMSTTYNSVVSDSRNFAVYGDNASYAGDTAYTNIFGATPVDGTSSAMKDWPWKAELIHVPECGADAEIVFKLVGRNGQNPVGAVLMNYDIKNAGTSSQELTGYQLLVNSGGGSLTLSRFNGANELATSFMDRYPNTPYGAEGNVNPISYGPYKGWNYRGGLFPAGGRTHWIQGSLYVAARYQYDNITDTTTISYEARPASGVDSTPGTYDEVVILNGADSLPTGGSFGIMAMNYHNSSAINYSDFDVVEFKMTCTIP